MSQVTLDTSVEELVENNPGANRFLADRHIMCVVCGEVFWGSLGALIAQKELAHPAQIVADLNAYLEEQDTPS